MSEDALRTLAQESLLVPVRADSAPADAGQLDVLVSIATAASGEADLGRMLAIALHHLRRLVRFSGGSIAVLEGGELVIRAAAGDFAEQALGQRLARGGGLSWRVVESGRPLLSNDLLADGARFLGGGIGETGTRAIRSYLAVPLRWHGQLFGLLEIDSVEPDAFGSTDLRLLEGVAAVLSGPIELARRYARETQLSRDLAQANGRLQALLEHAPMAIAFFDAHHQLAYANRAYHDDLRLLPEAELRLGRSWVELAEALARGRWNGPPERLRQIVEETFTLRGGILVHDFPLRYPEQLFRRIAAPVFESNVFSGHLVLYMDVSAERQALDEAQRALATRNQFLHVASHELKTPLTSVKAAAQLLLRLQATEPADPARAARQVGTIVGQVDRLRALVDDLIDVNAILSGRLELHPERLDLGRLVQRIVDGWAEQSQGRLRLTVSGAAPIHADPGRLTQVCVNLLANALKFSPPGTPVEVRVRVQRRAGHVLLQVQDHGIGIPRELQPRLFEPFARAESVADRGLPGFGLGLYVARHLIEAHGGSITAQSHDGRGTNFTVRLPLSPGGLRPSPPLPGGERGPGGEGST